MAVLLDFRKPPINILDKFVSHSGKYFVFFGMHYHKGKTCWDVGSSNRATGEIIRRHYNEDNNMAPEASAKTYWLEFKEKMQKKLDLPAEPTYMEELQQWLDINDPNWRKRRPS